MLETMSLAWPAWSPWPPALGPALVALFAPVAAAALGFSPSGCSRGGQAAAPAPSSGADAGASPISALRFDVAGGLLCANDAGAAAICVPTSKAITFGLAGIPGTVVDLSLSGDYADAALSAQQVTLSETVTQMTLASSSTTSSFLIVARVGRPGEQESVALHVTVTTSGLHATIDASPVYAGLRPATTFYAAGFELSTCAELTANAPDASTVAWTSGPNGVAIGVGALAVERVAVQMRLGHYAFGCADVAPLAPGTTTAILVEIYDVPMALSLTNLSAGFSFTPDATASSGWAMTMQAAVARIEGAFFGSTTPDGTALLDAMRAGIATSGAQAQFDLKRQQGGWDTLAATWLSTRGATISARADTWLTAATTDGIGPLGATIGNGTTNGTAPVSVATFGSLTSEAAGITQPSSFKWTADANDTVHLSGEIDLTSTPLVGHEADGHAASSASGATDVPSAIALGIDCTGLASSLVGTGVSYGTCNAACTTTLCGTALATAWKSAIAAAPGGADVVATTITASAQAKVGDLAEPAYVEGGWLGVVSGAGVPSSLGAPPSFPIAGNVLATEIPVAAPLP
jgi:hypothetical protein